MAHVLDAVIQLRDNFSSTLQTVEKNVGQFGRTVEKTGKSIGNTGKALESFGGNLTRKVTLPIVGTTAAITTSLVKAGIERNSFKEDTITALSTMMGSAKEAQKFMKELSDFSRKTPFAFPDLAAGARNLIAFGMEAKNVVPTLTAIGDAVAGIGGGGEELQSIVNVFGKIQSAGRLSMEEVNSLAVHGVPALQILANQAGITADEMRKQISKGTIDANTAIMWLVDGIEKGTEGVAGSTAKFAGLMDKNQGTWRGSLDKFRGAWARAGESIMEEHMPKITKAVQKITDVIENLPEIAGPAIDTVVDIFEKIVDKVVKLIDKFSKLDPATQQNILKMIGLAVALGPTILLLGKLVTSIGKLVEKFGKLSRSIKRLGLMDAIFTPGVKVVLIIGLLVIATVLLIKNWDKLKAAADKLKTKFNNLKQSIIDLKDNGVEAARKKFEDFKQLLEDNQTTIKATAGILGGIFGPALIKTGIEAVIAGGKIAVHFITNIIRTGTQAAINGAKLSATFVASVIRAGVQASIAGAKILIHFVGSLVKTATQAAITAAVIMGRLVFSLIVYAAQGWVTVFSVVATTFAIAAQRAVMIGATIATYALTAAQWALNFALSMNPIVWVVGLIAGLIIILITLYHKCENVRAKVDEMWNKLKTGAVNAINTVSEYWEKLKKLLSKPIVGVVKIVQKGKAAVEDKIGKNALGTHYWRGGLTWVGERGPELIELPRGTKIHPHDESIQIAGQSRGDTSTSVVITGNQFIVREESDIDKIAAAIVQKMKKAEVAYGGAW